MPANIVKTKKDEQRWREAKRQAARQGHKNDWDYIMGIFLRRKYHIGGLKAKRPWKRYLKKSAQSLNEYLRYISPVFKTEVFGKLPIWGIGGDKDVGKRMRQFGRIVAYMRHPTEQMIGYQKGETAVRTAQTAFARAAAQGLIKDWSKVYPAMQTYATLLSGQPEYVERRLQNLGPNLLVPSKLRKGQTIGFKKPVDIERPMQGIVEVLGLSPLVAHPLGSFFSSKFPGLGKVLLGYSKGITSRLIGPMAPLYETLIQTAGSVWRSRKRPEQFRKELTDIYRTMYRQGKLATLAESVIGTIPFVNFIYGSLTGKKLHPLISTAEAIYKEMTQPGFGKAFLEAEKSDVQTQLLQAEANRLKALFNKDPYIRRLQYMRNKGLITEDTYKRAWQKRWRDLYGSYMKYYVTPMLKY